MHESAVVEVADRDELERRLELLTGELLQLKLLLRGPSEPLPAHDDDVLIVEIAAGRYAIPVHIIVEVLDLVWPDPLPDSPAWILGSLRYGEVEVPIVDLRRRLLDEATPWSLRTKLVLVEHGGLRALVVDAVEELVRVRVDELTRPPPDVPVSPFLLGSFRSEPGHIIHLLSMERTCRELAAST